MRQESDRSAFGGDLDRVRWLTHATVREALTGTRCGVRPDDVLAESLRAVCSEARDAGLHAEDVILMIKESWRSLVESRPLSRREDESTLRDVVTRCITEYYRDGNAGRRR